VSRNYHGMIKALYTHLPGGSEKKYLPGLPREFNPDTSSAAVPGLPREFNPDTSSAAVPCIIF